MCAFLRSIPLPAWEEVNGRTDLTRNLAGFRGSRSFRRCVRGSIRGVYVTPRGGVSALARYARCFPWNSRRGRAVGAPTRAGATVRVSATRRACISRQRSPGCRRWSARVRRTRGRCMCLCVPRVACQIELNSRKLDSRADDSGLLARFDSSRAVDVPKYSRKQNFRAKIIEGDMTGNAAENFMEKIKYSNEVRWNLRGLKNSVLII